MESSDSLLSSLSDAIHTYMGLSPAALITILALMVGTYLFVSSMFVSASDAPRSVAPPAAVTAPPPPLTEPVQMGDVTLEDLRAYDGSDPSKPLLMAIKGQIYDVCRSRMFYGPGGPYALFAGRDASRALALMSFDTNDLTGNLEGLGDAELEVLQDWEYKFMEKYVKVGQLVSENSSNGEDNHSSKIPAGGCQETQKDAEPAKGEEKEDMNADKMFYHRFLTADEHLMDVIITVVACLEQFPWLWYDWRKARLDGIQAAGMLLTMILLFTSLTFLASMQAVWPS